MIEPFLVIAAVVMSILVLCGVVLIVIIFGHPDDHNTAWFPRIITIFGLFLAFSGMLVLPYDVAANANYNGNSGISVDVLWLIIFILMAVMVVLVIPFAFFYYENEMDDEEKPESFWDTQIGNAVKYTFGLIAIIILAFAIMYAYLNDANIPVDRIAETRSLMITGNTSLSLAPNANAICNKIPAYNPGAATTLTGGPCVSSLYYWIIPVSFPLYIVAFMAFVGWWFFASFVGVGFFALPLDLINSYRTRPTPISTKAYFEQRTVLGNRVKSLLELGEQMLTNQERGNSNKGVLAKQRERQDFRAFEKHYFYLKKDYQILYVAHKLKGGNPLVPIMELVFGIIAICLSILWYIHIAIFILPQRPFSQFLNLFFVDLTNDIPSFPLFGVCAFALFSFYLLWCVIKGNFKLGVRFLFFKIYPMEVGNTLMNAFLANTLIIILTSVPAVQFCIIAFPVYAQYTQANVMFGDQIKYLTFFRYFFNNNFFVIWILCISSLTILFLFLFPNNKAQSIEAQLDRLAKSTNTSLKDYADDLKE